MREVEFGSPIEKAEFVYSCGFMSMQHNYLCACCKESSAVQETSTGILQPCWTCQKTWKIKRLTWWDKFKEALYELV